MLKNYNELKVWQKSYQLCLQVYQITSRFAKEERYGLASQRAMAARQQLIISDLYILPMDPTVSCKRRSCYPRTWVIKMRFKRLKGCSKLW